MATYQEQTQSTLPYWTEAQNRLLGQGEQLYNQQRWGTVPQQGVAGLTPDQQAAFELARSSAGSWQPALDQSQQFLTQAGQGAQFDPNQVQQYLNPYLSGVIGEIGRLGQQGFQETVAPAIANQFGGLGQYGSARQAMALAEAGGRQQRETLGQQAGALKSAYDTAMQGYQDWTKMGIGAQQAAGTALGDLAQRMQGLYTGDIANLSTAGATQQKQQQDILNSQFQQWQQQQQYPWQALNQWADLFKTGQPQTSTSWNTGFKEGGLVRYATGGRFRDEEALERLLDEKGIDDPAVRARAKALAMKESSGRLDAYGPEIPSGIHKGNRAFGMFQLMPNTARELGNVDMSNPESASAGGLDYFLKNYDRFGDLDLATIAHHAGPGGAEKFLSTGAAGTRDLATGLSTDDYLNSVKSLEKQFAPISPFGPPAATEAAIALGPSMFGPPASSPDTLSDLQRANLELPGRAFNERVALLERARTAPELQAIPERSEIGKIGEALLRASAEGPANIGQFIGRSGKAYFDEEAALAAENKKRALERLAVEERIAPDVPRTIGAGAGGAGAVGRIKQVTDSSGRTWLYDDISGEMRELSGKDQNLAKITEAADRYARDLVDKGVYKTTDEKAAAYEKYKQDYMMGRVQQASSGKLAPPAGASVAESVSAGPNPSNANIESTAEQSESTTLGKGQAERFNKTIESGAAGYSMIDTLNDLELNLQGYDTGTFAPLKKTVFSALDEFGIKVDPTLGSKEAFESGTSKMALQLRNMGEQNLMPGAMSEQDREYLRKMAPRFENTPEGNRLIIEHYRKIAQRQIEKAEFAEDFLTKNPRGTTVGFEKAWREHVKNNNLFPDPKTLGEQTKTTTAPEASARRGKTPTTFEAMPDASKYEGKRLRADDGTMYRSVKGQWVKE